MSGVEDTNIFLAKGKSLELAKAHFAKRKAANEAREAHAKRHGGPDAEPYGTNFTYMGITTPIEPDAKLWRVSPKSRESPSDAKWPCYIPNIRTKAGKDLEAEMGNAYSGHGFHKVFSRPGNESFSHELGIGTETTVMDRGLALIYAHVWSMGDDVVILVPKQIKGHAIPPDAEQIPLSRYYAMQEALEAAKATGKGD